MSLLIYLPICLSIYLSIYLSMTTQIERGLFITKSFEMKVEDFIKKWEDSKILDRK